MSTNNESERNIQINQEELAAVKRQDKMLTALSNLRQLYSTVTKPLGEKYNQTQQHVSNLSHHWRPKSRLLKQQQAGTDQYNQWHDKLEQAYQSKQALKVRLETLEERKKADRKPRMVGSN